MIFKKSIVVVKNKHQYNLFVKDKSHKPSNYLKILIGAIDAEMEKEIDKLIIEHKLLGWEIGIWEITCGKQWHFDVSFGEPVIRKGIYFEYLGAARTGQWKGQCAMHLQTIRCMAKERIWNWPAPLLVDQIPTDGMATGTMQMKISKKILSTILFLAKAGFGYRVKQNLLMYKIPDSLLFKLKIR